MPLTFVKDRTQDENHRLRTLRRRAKRFGLSIQEATDDDPLAEDHEIGTFRVWDNEAHITAMCEEGSHYGMSIEQVASFLDEEGRRNG